jgi:CubicO group peptidase (beta-lactamase class C family)
MRACWRIPPFAIFAALLGSCGNAWEPRDGPAQGLLSVPAAEAGLDPAPLRNLEQAVGRGEFPKTTSVLIVRDGKLAYEHYFGEGHAQLLNNTRSAMKSITSLAVETAIADGSIASVHDPAFSYLGDLRPFAHDTPDKESITIEDMLTMSSALDCNDDDDKSPGNEDNMHPQPDWSRWAVDLPTARGYMRDQSGLGSWRYCTTNAFLLGQVVQRAVKMRVDRYIEERILQPLGIARWQWSYSPSGEVMTGGGLELRSRDLAAIAWMLVAGGRWNGHQVVPHAWVDATFTTRRDAYPGLKYGYFFWEQTYASACGPVEGWFMAGNGGNAIVMLRQLKAAIVLTRTNYNAPGMHRQTKDLLEHYAIAALPCAHPTG